MLEHMSDESVCELLEVGLGMLARARLSEGLRNTAQSCVQVIVRACFTRLKELTPEDVEALLAAARQAEDERERREKRKADQTAAATIGKAPTGTTVEQGGSGSARPSAEVKRTSIEGQARQSTERASEPDAAEEEEGMSTGLNAAQRRVADLGPDLTPPPFTPYGLPTILELLRVLIALLNPSDQAHTDSMRLAALSILNTALEVGGSSLGQWPELREGVRDEGCRYLFQVSLLFHGLV